MNGLIASWRSPVMMLGLILTLTSCSVLNPVSEESEGEGTGTLADLKPLPLEAVQESPQQVSIDEVIRHYSDLLTDVEDPEVRAKILYRLADLRMLKTDEADVAVDEAVTEAPSLSPGDTAISPGDTAISSGDPVLSPGNPVMDPVNPVMDPGREYALTIETYQALLREYPDRPENDQVYYQLAKAYDLQGDREASLENLEKLIAGYPESLHIVEAEFRRGEILYSYSEYQSAEQAFDRVVSLSNATNPYYDKALYMKGWSQFKQGAFEKALTTFVSLLDLQLGKDPRIQLTAEQDALVKDQFRVMGFAFSYLDGAESVKDLFARVGARHYEHLIYEDFARFLIEREQELDAIALYQQYLRIHPNSKQAPLFHARAIDLELQQGLVAEARQEKALYVERYGLQSDYWPPAVQKGVIRLDQPVAERLGLYLDELAKYHHARAQMAAAPRQAAGDERTVAANVDSGDEYRLAARYYSEFANTFPESPKTPEMVFLLGEVRNELGDLRQAIVAYEKAAYDYPDYSGGAEAGYAAVTIYDRLVDQADEQNLRSLVLEQVDSQERFADRYRSDPRAVAVQANAAASLFELNEYRQAIKASAKLVDWQPQANADVRLNAWLTISHSHFALAQYSQAEASYQTALELMPQNDSRLNDTRELLAASVYRQAEALISQGRKSLAIDEFLRVGMVVPGASVRKNADYDAATTMLELRQFERAIPVLESFRQRYPQDPLTSDIPAKLSVAYREVGQWDKAGAELESIAAGHPDPEVRRTSLLAAAELYQEKGLVPEAINAYRTYAHTYSEPAEMMMEAQFAMTELYELTGEADKKAFWLRKLESSYQANQNNATDRMRYLAAGASMELADQAFAEFDEIRLKAPLKQNLVRKKQAMQKALKAYKKTSDYLFADYTTKSTYRVGEIYARFSRELIDSERPPNLSALELEQYELLLEDQAYPFEEDAIRLHENNIQRSWQGIYDQWVKNSFDALEQLYPVRYNKPERVPVVSDEIL